jgi:hypothetical protein
MLLITFSPPARCCGVTRRQLSTFPEVTTSEALDLSNKAHRETLKNLVEVELQKVIE